MSWISFVKHRKLPEWKKKNRLGTNQLPLAIGHSQYQKLFLALFGCGQHKKTKIFPKQQLRMFSLKVTSCLYIYYYYIQYIYYVVTVYSIWIIKSKQKIMSSNREWYSCKYILFWIRTFRCRHFGTNYSKWKLTSKPS